MKKKLILPLLAALTSTAFATPSGEDARRIDIEERIECGSCGVIAKKLVYVTPATAEQSIALRAEIKRNTEQYNKMELQKETIRLQKEQVKLEQAHKTLKLTKPVIKKVIKCGTLNPQIKEQGKGCIAPGGCVDIPVKKIDAEIIAPPIKKDCGTMEECKEKSKKCKTKECDKSNQQKIKEVKKVNKEKQIKKAKSSCECTESGCC